MVLAAACNSRINYSLFNFSHIGSIWRQHMADVSPRSPTSATIPAIMISKVPYRYKARDQSFANVLRQRNLDQLPGTGTHVHTGQFDPW
jgi:hypothetical protein